jgi:hypothetical protein
MAARKPLVIVSGLFSELPAGDTAVVLAAAPSGLIYVGSSLGIDGSAQISGNAGISAAVTAQASGNAALVVGVNALASGNLGVTNAATAQASGNAALVVGATATTNAATALASGNAALVVGANALASGNLGVTNSATALASGNAALASVGNKYDKTGGPISGPVVVQKQSFGTVNTITSSGVLLLDLSTGNNFTVTLETSATFASPTNASGGQCGAITIRQDNTGSRTLAYSGTWSFQGGTAPTLTTSASGIDVLSYYVVSPTRVVGILTANYSGGSQ